jgi:hypothetical protein
MCVCVHTASRPYRLCLCADKGACVRIIHACMRLCVYVCLCVCGPVPRVAWRRTSRLSFSSLPRVVGLFNSLVISWEYHSP